MAIRERIRTIGIVLRNTILGSNLVSLTLIRNPTRMAVYVTECLFYYKTLGGKRGIPQKNVFEVLPSNNIEEVKLGYLNSGGTWFVPFSSRAADIVSLCLICRIIKPKVVFEIGTMRGYTAFHFALNTPDDTRVYTLDLLKSENVNTTLKTTAVDDALIKSYVRSQQYCFENSDVASRITCLFGDSATFDFSPFYGKVDFFFIDGAHSYEYVRSDTLNALKCCHAGSVIAWHDFGRLGVNGVTRWILELSKEGRDICVIPGGSVAFMVVK
jgi:predicted O-methyltransferase YrrM